MLYPDNGLDTNISNKLKHISEIGKSSKSLLKSLNYGKDYPSTPLHPPKTLTLEFGDALFSLLSLANASGIDLEEALKSSLAKYQSRFNQDGTIGSGK